MESKKLGEKKMRKIHLRWYGVISRTYQGRGKVVVQIIQSLINNNTRINSVFHVITTVNLLLPHPLIVKGKKCKTVQREYVCV